MLPCLCWEILPPNWPKRKTFAKCVFFFCCTDAHFHGGACNCQTINLWFKFHFSDRNSTAVCIYSMETIENIFERSSFKGYNKDIPHPRPGTVKTSLASAQRWKTFWFPVLFLYAMHSLRLFATRLFCHLTLTMFMPCHNVWRHGSVLSSGSVNVRVFFFSSSNQFSCSSRNWRKLWKGPVQ